VAKVKAKSDTKISVEFPRTGNAWLDAGIVGLYRVLDGRPAYVDEPSDATEPPYTLGFEVALENDRLVLSGTASQIQGRLEWAYDLLVATYFNVSSRKQMDDAGSHNFYYDRDTDQFVTFPKKKAVGAASLLFDKAARPSGTQDAWGAGADGQREAGRMPASLSHLQGRLDAFLAEHGLKPGPPAGLLIDGPNQVRPKVEIRVEAPVAKPRCFLTGDPASAPVEAKETAFPLLGGSRSFINGGENWPRLSWKVDFVGKFVPALAFFYRQGDDLQLFFPQSNDLRRINALATVLKQMVDLEPNLFRNFNFDPKLGGYFSRRSEVTVAFLHRVFVTLTNQQAAARADRQVARREASEGTITIGGDEEDQPEKALEAEPDLQVSASDVIRQTQAEGPVGFAVVSATKKGNVWMARDFWTFQDVVYLARLFEAMQKLVPSRSGMFYPLCRPSGLLHALRDNEAGDETRTLLRDRVCEAILHRRPVLHLIERHAFHADSGKANRVGPLFRFACLYEIELRKGTEMDKDGAYQKMVEAASWLGKTIGEEIVKAVKDPEKRESPGRSRGALFRLRKTRSVADFVNELARLQFRYSISVPPTALDGSNFNPDSFEEFRGFCVVAALNKFLLGTGEFTRDSKPAQTQPAPGK
jgi:hypothetical protein